MSSELDQERITQRPVNPGAEKWLGPENRIPVLDHGYVYLVDYMGDDAAIEQAARVSYGTGTRKASETRGLIRYLLRHQHTTPFEMVELKFHAKMPIAVARQWVRHRTANINEYSARYSILDKEFYIPEPAVVAVQSKGNRQGREEPVPIEYAEKFREELRQIAIQEYNVYEHYLNDDGTGQPVDPSRPMISREIARMPLGVSFYTQWYWKCDLHNILHFLQLRMDPHAQWEIRQYANAMAEIVKDAVPITWEAFNDYVLESINFSGPEKKIITGILEEKGIVFTEEEILAYAQAIGLTNKREVKELVEKLSDIGLIK